MVMALYVNVHLSLSVFICFVMFRSCPLMSCHFIYIQFLYMYSSRYMYMCVLFAGIDPACFVCVLLLCVVHGFWYVFLVLYLCYLLLNGSCCFLLYALVCLCFLSFLVYLLCVVFLYCEFSVMCMFFSLCFFVMYVQFISCHCRPLHCSLHAFAYHCSYSYVLIICVCRVLFASIYVCG